MMQFHVRLLRSLSLATLDSDVMVSQITAFSRQVPLLYVIGNANALALAYTHYGTAPTFLTLVVPVPMCLACLVRICLWLGTGPASFTQETARARLRSTVLITCAMGSVYAAWALCLYPYGDAYAQCHVAFFMSITVIGTVFCLMHLLPAALLLTGIVTVPFVIRFTTTGVPTLTAMAWNFLLVTAVMIFILFIYYRDFGQLVRSEKALAALSNENMRLANLDSLTGLPNRRSFFRELETRFESAQGTAILALGMIDLDGFKPINDLYGHAAGDQVLVEVGRRLEAVLEGSAFIARLGGDEFGLLVTASDSTSTVGDWSTRICAAIRAPIRLSTGTACVSASIGFALSRDGTTLTTLMERADFALYRAKAEHRGKAVLFSDHHEDAMRRQMVLEHELRKANFEREMTMRFQPIVDTATNQTVCYEALARWRNPVLGDVSPIDFVAAAERAGLISTLTPVLFAKSLDAMRQWKGQIGLSFNLSVNDLASTDSVEAIRSMLTASGPLACRVIFEITETALMRDFEAARSALLGFKLAGAKIALDDFGTGFSSLNYVHRLPLDRIKIDRSFVSDIESDATSRNIMKSMVDLCKSLDITCIAEGVETAAQVCILQSLGCRTMQGYYFGVPALAGDLNTAAMPGLPNDFRQAMAS